MREMLLMISLLGFLLLFRWARKDLHPAFFPALTVSFLSLINCLGGLLGVLAWTAKGLLILGVCLFPVMVLFARANPMMMKRISRTPMMMPAIAIRFPFLSRPGSCPSVLSM